MLFDPLVTLEKDTHIYSDKEGEIYRSVSKVLDLVKEDFDRDGISLMMAKKMAKEDGMSIEAAQSNILSKWGKNLEFSQDTGNFIHDNLELYFKTGDCDSGVLPAARSIAMMLKGYHKFYPELVIYNKDYKVAGMADLPAVRTRSKNSVIDIFDYKSNTSKGIEFDTAKRDKWGRIEKFYNRFMLDPLSHLEATNYNFYALQMSLYALMIQMLTGRKIGRLALLFVEYKTMDVIMYPVPYLKLEAKLLLEHQSDIKQLPVSNQQWSD
jgi:hypothetical protein